MELSPLEIGLLAAIALLLLLIAAILLFKNKSGNADDTFLRLQMELSGRLTQFFEHYSLNQDKFSQLLSEQKLSILKMIDDKLLQVTQKVGEGLQLSNAKTDETLASLRERLVKIDAAQQKISGLSEQVVSLQEILSNKQARGAFGEIQLYDLVSNVLPPSVYSFQAVMSNQKRADCLLRLPNPPGAIVVDSKFPLESYRALSAAQNDREKQEAERFFRTSVAKHIKDIADKYIITGETADSALMFLPSESVYAELYAHFPEVVEYSYRMKVWIVSPTTLMATLHTIRAVLKDVKMQEQSGIIQKEVMQMGDDVARLEERVESLSKHFEQAQKDVGDIKTSSTKISRRIERLGDIETDKSQKISASSTVFVDKSA